MNMKNILIALVLISGFQCKSQAFIWATHYNNYWQDKATGLGIDSSGNIYITGTSIYPASNNQSSGYIMFYKFDPNGNLIWKDTLTHGIGTSVTDKGGNTFMVAGNYVFKYGCSGQQIWAKTLPGKFFRNVGVRPGGGVIVTGEATSSYSIGIISAFDDNGTNLWNRNGDFCTGNGVANAIASDKYGYIYITGDSAVGQGGVSRVKKFDPNGNLLKSISVSVEPSGVAVSKDQSIYVLGQYYSATNTHSVYVSKYNSQGVLQWTNTLSSPSGIFEKAIAVDTNNNVFITGMYYYHMNAFGTLYNSSTMALFVAKLTPSGNFLWMKSNVGQNGDVNPIKCLVDKNENIIVAGSMTEQQSFDEIFLNGPAGYADIFLCKISNTEQATSVPELITVKNEVNVYPSPTHGLFNINFEPLTSNVRITIINSAGQRIYSETNQKANGSYNKVFDLSSLPKGIYFVEVNNGAEKTVKKIVLE
jgi:hypothetical protein